MKPGRGRRRGRRRAHGRSDTVSCRIVGAVPTRTTAPCAPPWAPAPATPTWSCQPSCWRGSPTPPGRPWSPLTGPVSSAEFRAEPLGVAPLAYDMAVRDEQLSAMRSDGLNRSVAGIFQVWAASSAAFVILVIILELAATARDRSHPVSFLRPMGLPARSASTSP